MIPVAKCIGCVSWSMESMRWQIHTINNMDPAPRHKISVTVKPDKIHQTPPNINVKLITWNKRQSQLKKDQRNRS
jgi:hypothetical protein